MEQGFEIVIEPIVNIIYQWSVISISIKVTQEDNLTIVNAMGRKAIMSCIPRLLTQATHEQ